MTGVVIDVQTESTQANKDLAKINESLRNIEKTSSKTSQAVSTLFKGLGTALVSGFSIGYLAGISNEFTNLGNRIALVTGRTKALASTQRELFNISEQTRGSIKNTVDIFSTFGRALGKSGTSTTKLLSATKAVQEAIAISGGNAESARAAIIQLGQGISSGTLRGEELNSVMEQTPRIAQAIADNMGVAQGKLRALAEEGKITSKIVFAALLGQAKTINSEFKDLAPTLAQGTGLATTNLKLFINEFDKGFGASEALGKGLLKISSYLKGAADDAFDMGVKAHAAFESIRYNIKPIIGVIGAIGEKFKLLIPRVFVTNTQKGEVRELFRLFDDSTGGALTTLKNFKIAYLFTIESTTEKAVRAFRRLNPANWFVDGSFDKQTFERLFSKEYFLKILDAFRYLEQGLREDTKSIGVVVSDFIINMKFNIFKFLRYVGLIPDTLFQIKEGNVASILISINRIIKGMFDLQLSIFEVGRILIEYLGPNFLAIFITVGRAFGKLPGMAVRGFAKVIDLTYRMVASVKTILTESLFDSDIFFTISALLWHFKREFVKAFSNDNDFFVGVLEAISVLKSKLVSIGSGAFAGVTNLGKLLADSVMGAAKEILKLSRKINESLGLEPVINYIRNFAIKIIEFFKRIYDEVIGHSWWTDTIDSIIAQSRSLYNAVRAPFSRFGNYILSLFEKIAKTIGDFAATKFLDNFYKFNIGEIDKIFTMLSKFSSRSIAFDLKVNPTGFDKLLHYADTIFIGLVLLAKTAAASIGHMFLVMFSKITTFFGDIAVKTIINNIEDLSSTARKLLNKIFARHMDAQIKISLNWDRSTFDYLLYYAETIFASVAAIAVIGLDIAARAVIKFARKIIDLFRDIYDKVIGHSWWTDTIENIVSTSSTLWARSKKGLIEFRDNTLELFKTIFKGDFSFKLNTKDIAKAAISLSRYRIPTISVSNIGDTLVQGLVVFKKKFKETLDAFPSIVKIALNSVAAIIVAALIPSSLFKAALLGVILSGIVTSSAILGEQLAISLTDKSFIEIFARRIGSIIGALVNSFFRELPHEIDALLTFMAGFFKGFIAQMPLVGKLLEGILTLGGKFGLGGPLGVVGAYLLGSNIKGLLSGLGVIKASTEKSKTYFGDFLSFLDGKSEGAFGKFMYGNIGAKRTLAIIGLLGDSLGVFDSIFAGSPLAKMAARGGLLYLAVLGDAGWNAIVKSVGLNVIAPISKMFQDFVKNITKGTKLSDVFFGSQGTWSTRASTLITALLNAMSKKIIDYSASWASKGFDFLSHVLFGTNPKKTLDKIKSSFDPIIKYMTGSLNKISKIDIWKIAGAIPGIASLKKVKQQNFVGPVQPININDEAMKKFFKAGEYGMKNFVSLAEKLGGTDGILGRLLLGKWGKAALFATLLLLVSKVAFAAEKTNDNAVNDQKAKTSDLLKTWNSLKLNNPLGAFILEFTAALATMTTGVLLFSARARAALASAFSMDIIKRFTSAALAGLVGVAKQYKRSALTIVAGVGAAVAGYAQDDSLLDAFNWAAIAAGIAAFLPEAVIASLASIGGAIVSLIFSPIAAFIAGLAAIGGLLYIWLFGESGNFLADLETVYQKVKEMLGFKAKLTIADQFNGKGFKDAKNSGLDIQSKPLNEQQLGRLSAADRKIYDERVTELIKALANVSADLEESNRVSEHTRSVVKDADKLLSNLTSKFEAKTQGSRETAIEQIRKLTEFKPTSTYAKFDYAQKQDRLDFIYSLQNAIIDVFSLVSFSEEDKRARAKERGNLQEERSTKYNASYKGLRPSDNATLKLLEDYDKLTYKSDLLEGSINSLSQAYAESLQKISDAEKTWWGGTSRLSDNDPLILQAKKLREKVNDLYFESARYDLRQTQVVRFQGELSNLEAVMKDVGLAFDSTVLFAKDRAQFDNLKAVSSDLKKLQERLKETKDVVEHNKLIVEIGYKRQEADIALINTPNDPTKQLQQSLIDFASGNNFDKFSKETLASVDDVAAQEIKGIMQVIAIARKALISNLNDRGVNIAYQKQLAEALGAALPGTQIDNETVREMLKSKGSLTSVITGFSGHIADKLKERARDTTSLIGDLSQSGGVSIDKAILGGYNKTEIQSLLDDLTSLNSKLSHLRDAEATGKLGGSDGVITLSKEIEDLRTKINITTLSFSSLMGIASTGGNQLSVSDLLGFSGKDFENLRNATLQLDVANKAIEKLQANGSNLDKLKGFIKNQIDATKQLFEASLKTLYSTPNKIIQGLGRFGISDLNIIKGISPADVKALEAAEIKIKRIQAALDNPNNTKPFTQIVSELVAAQAEADKLAKKLGKSFGGQLSDINSAFSANTTQDEFARIPQEARDGLSQVASDYLEGIKNILATGNTPVGGVLVSAANFFDAMAKRMFNAKDTLIAAGANSLKALLQFKSVSDQQSFVQENIPEYTGSKDTYAKLSEEAKRRITDVAVDVNTMAKRFDELGNASGYSAIEVANFTKAAGNKVNEIIKSSQDFGESSRSRLDKLGISVDKSSYNLINDAQEKYITGLLDAIEEYSSIANTAGLDRAAVESAQRIVDEAKAQLKDGISKFTLTNRDKPFYEAGKSFATSIVESFKNGMQELLKGNISFKQFALDTLNNITGNIIDTFTNGLTEAVAGESSPLYEWLQTIGGDLFNAGGAVGDQLKPADLQTSTTAIVNATSMAADKIVLAIRNAPLPGTGNGDYLTLPSPYSVDQYGLDTASDQSKQLAEQDAVFKDSNSEMRSTLYNAWSDFGKLLDNKWSSFSNILGMAFTGILGGGSGGGGIGDILGGVGSFFGGSGGTSQLSMLADQTGWMDAFSLMFFANGGAVKGPGSGTSDSIPAMLSNGEFVVNSKATSEHFKLLQQINTGKVGKFAKGGLVGAAIMNTPVMANFDKKPKEDKPAIVQTFNINVTGDVSQQTRSEIQKMIPNISHGVNAYQQEVGNRR